MLRLRILAVHAQDEEADEARPGAADGEDGLLEDVHWIHMYYWTDGVVVVATGCAFLFLVSFSPSSFGLIGLLD